MRLYGRAGVSLSTGPARFAAAYPAAGSFASDVAQPGAVGPISAGAEILDAGTPTHGLRRDGAFGSGLTGHAGRLSVNCRV